MSKGFWIIIGALAAVFIGIAVFNDKDTGAPATDKSVARYHIGAGNKGVTVLEYGDFQCPYCALYYPVVKQVLAKYGDDIRFEFRHLPLPTAHPNAFAASRAAEAAGQQGKFWEMHDKLYENQQAWGPIKNPRPVFDQYAKELGLNAAQFSTDFASSKINRAVNSDIKAFDATKQKKQTPTYFLNGKAVKPGLAYNPDQTVNIDESVKSFTKIIDAEIKKQKK